MVFHSLALRNNFASRSQLHCWVIGLFIYRLAITQTCWNFFIGSQNLSSRNLSGVDRAHFINITLDKQHLQLDAFQLLLLALLLSWFIERPIFQQKLSCVLSPRVRFLEFIFLNSKKFRVDESLFLNSKISELMNPFF